MYPKTVLFNQILLLHELLKIVFTKEYAIGITTTTGAILTNLQSEIKNASTSKIFLVIS